MKHQATHTMRLIRTIHTITITPHGTAGELLEAIKQCPPKAKIVDRDWDEDGDTIKLIFEEEIDVTE